MNNQIPKTYSQRIGTDILFEIIETKDVTNSFKEIFGYINERIIEEFGLFIKNNFDIASIDDLINYSFSTTDYDKIVKYLNEEFKYKYYMTFIDNFKTEKIKVLRCDKYKFSLCIEDKYGINLKIGYLSGCYIRDIDNFRKTYNMLSDEIYFSIKEDSFYFINNDSFFIDILYIEKEFRNKGFGDKLLGEVEKIVTYDNVFSKAIFLSPYPLDKNPLFSIESQQIRLKKFYYKNKFYDTIINDNIVLMKKDILMN